MTACADLGRRPPIAWDAAGNMLTSRGRSFAWDGENRPASITVTSSLGDTTVSFAYGPDGERIRKSVPFLPTSGCTGMPAHRLAQGLLGHLRQCAPDGITHL